MGRYPLVVVGTSAGGVKALQVLAAGLPADLPAAVLAVCHIPAYPPSRLAEILDRTGTLPAAPARDGEPILPGRIRVAPTDHHLVVEGDHLRLTHGPRENRMRPAIDPLFRSAARYHGPAVLAVLLTGGGDDGLAGLMAVRNAGGTVVVQDPDEAFLDVLPRQALALVPDAHVVPLAALPPLLVRLVHGMQLSPGAPAMNDPIERLPGQVAEDRREQETNGRAGQPSVYSCPECGGVLWQVDDPRVLRFRCHVGHAYYAEQLLDGQADLLDSALWTAVRTFRDRATLSRQLAERAAGQGDRETARRFQEQAEVADRQGEVIERHLLRPDGGLFAPPRTPAAGPAKE